MSIRRRAYEISILAGGKIFAGMIGNSLRVTPNYEPVLVRSLYGALVDELVSFDIEMNVDGLTYMKTVDEEETHQDFTQLRETAASGGSVAFIYGDITGGSDAATGTARILEYAEIAGSSRYPASWSLKLKGVRGSVSWSAPVGYTVDSTAVTVDSTLITVDSVI